MYRHVYMYAQSLSSLLHVAVYYTEVTGSHICFFFSLQNIAVRKLYASLQSFC